MARGDLAWKDVDKGEIKKGDKVSEGVDNAGACDK
jgi:hypothetical protein